MKTLSGNFSQSETIWKHNSKIENTSSLFKILSVFTFKKLFSSKEYQLGLCKSDAIFNSSILLYFIEVVLILLVQ
jgi:hypothetical protein